MGLLGGDTLRDTVIAWGFVVVQLALIVAVVVLLVVALVNLNTSLTALPTPTPHATLKTGGLYRFVRHRGAARVPRFVPGWPRR